MFYSFSRGERGGGGNKVLAGSTGKGKTFCQGLRDLSARIVGNEL